MRNLWYQVEYERVHRICSTCGCYRNLTRHCTIKATPERNEKKVNIAKTIPTVVVDLFVAPITRFVTKIAGTSVTNINQDRGEDHEDCLDVNIKIGNLPTINPLTWVKILMPNLLF